MRRISILNYLCFQFLCGVWCLYWFPQCPHHVHNCNLHPDRNRGEVSQFSSHCNAGLVRLITVRSPAVWYKGVSIADLMGSRHHGEPPYQIWSVKWYPSEKSLSHQPTQVNGMFLSLRPLPISNKYFNWRKYFCENVWVRWDQNYFHMWKSCLSSIR